MHEYITDTLSLKRGCTVDKQLLDSIYNILNRYNISNVDIIIVCDKIKYTFNSFYEYFDFANKLIYSINKITIKAILHSAANHITNSIEITFNNESTWDSNVNIEFNFHSNDEYIVIKNELESLLKNYRLNYTILARTPLLISISVISFFGICLYTWIKDIVYPKWLCFMISIICFGIPWLSYINVSKRIKKFLFPLNEFKFGINSNKDKKAQTIRNFIGITVVVAIIIGIIVNFISDIIF